MNEQEHVLYIEGLSVSFDGFKAVDDLSLYIDKGEIRVIIGPNGAGKTTVLDLICGKTKATKGSILFNNREILGLSENEIVKAGIGRKFQTPSIYEELTVFENLELSYPKGTSVLGSIFFKLDKEIKQKIQETAETIMLQDSLNTKSALLSHGQKQWLEIGMLLIQNPKLLMLDEPVAGMSITERTKTAELLHKIIKNRSVIVIEHDMKFVENIADRVTVMHQGKILAEGSIQSIKNNPKVIDVYLGHQGEK
ncbi:urea ABC transporter ATP-binding protein UrtD [Succinatimonas hippei]|uniref:urea ABC transporter ATP-binding protein UrtD n=1 Tax=Succinatimonas hippei TaxID=626938 RepID=UPI00201285E5|nr:urea ABC transporter ATP-binding protein UrtD [Succinatimonas hippei]MCL1602940.1 urea ABC transporter ATP-binding protein UrtD [Succinatimonas hippei]